jgi:hypothetical protein
VGEQHYDDMVGAVIHKELPSKDEINVGIKQNLGYGVIK